MSDAELGNIAEGVGKSSKKNKKRKSKKPADADSSSNGPKTLTSREMLELLKGQLEEAKAKKDHKRCGELRDQVWVLTDLIAGVRTRIEEKELNKIIESIHAQFHPKISDSSDNQAVSVSSDNQAVSVSPGKQTVSGGEAAAISAPLSTSMTVPLEDKKIKALRKKLDQIEQLKERQASGEKLELNQLEKIKSEESIRKEIQEMEELLQSVLVMKH